jgi:hypothetical protein
VAVGDAFRNAEGYGDAGAPAGVLEGRHVGVVGDDGYGLFGVLGEGGDLG